MTGDLEREVRAALEAAYRSNGTGRGRTELIVQITVPVVVRLIEEQRAPLIETAETWRRAAEAEVGAGRAQVARAERAEAEVEYGNRNLNSYAATIETLRQKLERTRALANDLIGLCDFHAGLTPPRHPREERVRGMAFKILAALDGTETTR